jgi:hypothetical protein
MREEGDNHLCWVCEQMIGRDEERCYTRMGTTGMYVHRHPCFRTLEYEISRKRTELDNELRSPDRSVALKHAYFLVNPAKKCRAFGCEQLAACPYCGLCNYHCECPDR